MRENVSSGFSVVGRVTNSQGAPLPGLVVRAYLNTPSAGEQVVERESIVNADGRYDIEISADELRRARETGHPTVFVRAFDGETPRGQSEPQPIVEPRTTIDLRLEDPRPNPKDPWLRVHGTVRDQNGDLMDRVTVQAFDRDLRSEQSLGSVPTRAGRYEIRYRRSQFRKAEKDSADLLLKILDAEAKELYRTPIQYNVPDDYELNITLSGTTYRGPSEWEVLTSTIAPLLEGVAPVDLREDDQYQDISFLAGETGNSRLTIAIWVACYRLAEKTAREKTPLQPEVFYGFIRQGQPSIFYDNLVQDMQSPDRMALLEDKILRGLAEIIPDRQQALLEKAIADNLIPLRVGSEIKSILDTLHQIKLRYAADITFGGGKGTIGQLLDLTPAKPQQAAFIAAFTAHTGPLNDFWKKLADDKVLPPETVQQVKLTFEVGALTRNHIPLVGELIRRFQNGEIKAKRDLAKLDRADWIALFKRPGPDGQPIGVPDNIDGATPEAKLEQFAAILDQQLQRAYPTASFAGKLGRAQASPLKAKSDVVIFLDNNPGFQLDRFRIDHYIADNRDALQGVKDPPAMLGDLKSAQRVFKLSPDFLTVDVLLTQKIDSAQQIYFMGQGQFVTSMTKAGLNKIEAKKLYRKAENTYALALTVYGDYSRAVNGAVPDAVPSLILDSVTQAKVSALPNLQTLFGSLDYCECTYCRSVYSPAAYLVDIMRYLGERGTQGTGINAGKTVRQVMLERRPDLGEIELSCENTNTPLPYIDLVNELLEDVVAPPTPVTLSGAIEVDLVAGPIKPSVLTELTARSVAIGPDALVYDPDSRGQWAIRDAQHAYKVFKTGATLRLLPTKQTLLSAAEVRANPENTNGDAYDKLRGEVFPLNLPFDLWLLQTRSYLDHLGVPQSRLLELFQQKLADDVTLSPSGLQIDSAWLNLSETERKILTDTLAGKNHWDYWGLSENGNDIPNPNSPADPTANITGTWINVLSSVDVMLNRSGLTYAQLLQLLDMLYVNPTGSVFIFDTGDSNAAECDTSKFTIRNLNTDALNRIHRFIRLWRKLGCAMWELDVLLPDTNPSPNVVDKRITDAVLQDISRMRRLRDQFGLDWRVVSSLYNTIDNATYLDRGQEGAPAVQTLYQRLFRNKLVDAVATFPASPEQITGSIAAKVPGILAAFRIKEADLAQILTDLGLATTDNLDATVLSQIYRMTVLAKALNLSVDAFLRLKRLWAKDPFADPGATLAFVDVAREVAASEFSVLELDYLLAHRFTPNSGVALEDKTILAALQALRDGLKKISDDLRLKSEETKEAYVKGKLGRLPTLAKDKDQAIALSIIDGTWIGTTADRDAFIDAFFAGVLELVVAKTNLAAIPGGLSPANHQAAVDARFDYVQPALEAFLLQTQKDSFVRQKSAEVVALDVPTAGLLLGALHLPGVANTLLQSINDPRLLAQLADGTYQFALNEASFPDIFKSLRLLHKDALLVAKLHLKAPDVAWWLDGTRAADLGWMHPRDFPIDTTTKVVVDKWLAIEQFFQWRSSLPKSDLTALEFASNVLDATTSSAANLADLANLTASDATDLTRLATAFHWLDTGASFDVVKQQLRQSANLIRLADCLSVLRRLGVNADRAVLWARAEPDSSTADGLKQTVKAKYDLTQWQQVIQPLQDEFREQKRAALVGWLVAHPNQSQGQSWTDSNGLYSYFLIDVEMSACMLTSRLKQAAASAQLFVQRCLLNLEVDLLARTDLDPKWKQWKWMKHFRVWEANRKVFLYPENWIEPELRDEKSPFFNDLVNELQQNDVTADSVEQAYLNYLEKLDKVANLEIRAMFNEVISQDESVLHAFGRSRSSQAPEYYYRKRINRGRWLAWEKVELDINANHLVPGIHNRRLVLLWPQFLEKADAPTNLSTPAADSSTNVAQPNRYWEIRLFWSELKKGKWTPKILTDSFVTLYESQTGGNHPENVDFRARLAPEIQTWLYRADDPTSHAPTGVVLFDKLGKQVNPQSASIIEHLIAPAESEYSNNLIQHTTSSQYFYYGSVEETGKPHVLSAHENAVTIRLLRNIDARQTFSVIDAQAKGFANDGSFFVWDPHRTYFVDYSWRLDWSYFSRAWHSRQISSFRFFTHYHPFVELFIKELNIWGIKGLLNRPIQVDPASIPGSPPPFNFAGYQPDNANVVLPLPVEDVDFTYLGAYSPYNWELFFHVPFFIANRLSANQHFEEALEWYHYVFDPTSTDTATADPDTPQQKFWITKPFYETTRADYYKQKIENILLGIAKGDAELIAQVNEWRDHPFNPHLIARMRTVAYQKNVLMKYIQTLIAWGDQLFGQDTIETINEATQLYILAASVLGPRPKSIPKKVANPIKTFYQLQQEGIDAFGNTLKEVENLLPSTSSSTTQGEDAPELPHLDVLYFCIPNNEKLLTLWDTVDDRLFKIRHCMNIAGVVRQLPLFEPPIDPALLVKATAAGLDIGEALSDMNAPLPLYRFTTMIQRAVDMCAEVKALGYAMQAALEKHDAEALARLRASNELNMLDQVRHVRQSQVAEAQKTLESIQETKKVVEARRDYYQKLSKDGWSIPEITAFSLSTLSTGVDVAIAAGYILSGGLKLIPDFLGGAAGFGGSPTVTVTMGGQQIGNGAEMAVKTLESIASALDKGAMLASTVAAFDRRGAEWDYQKTLAETELPQVDKQIAAADIRHQIAEKELENHDKQKENLQAEDDFMHSKFTNQELADWTISQLSTTYFQSYQLAYDLAKRAERCFRYELGLSDSSYVQFGYWDSLYKGLLSGEKLFYDLKRLEAAYYEQNRREYELTKHVSLAQIDPTALLKLRQNGECFVDIPEVAFDMDYPGHYFRRIKSVALSIPCTVGPYTTAACTLTLTSNHLRKDATLLAGKYVRDTTIDDPRFRDEIAGIQSIATSNAQKDHGMFELNFRDERYLPFEGAGAISSWHIKLNKSLPQFDFATISDLIIHLDYTAREGGDLLGSKAVEEFNKKLNELALAENRKGLFRVFDLKREYSDKWYRFFHPANPADDQSIVLDDLADRLPYFTRGFATKKVRQVEIVARMKDGATYKAQLSTLGVTPADLLTLAPDPTYAGLDRAFKDLTGSEIDFGAWTLKIQRDGAGDFKSLPADAIQELFLNLNYTIA